MSATPRHTPAAAPGPAGAAAPGGPPPGYDWRYPPPVPAPARRSKWLAVAVAAAILLSVSALAVGITALTRPTATTPSEPTSAAARPAEDTTAADRALCTAIAPLMAESNRVERAYQSSGEAGSPEREAATARYVSDTGDWVTRVQPIIDSNPDADPFFLRSLQRFVDDQRLLAYDLAASGPHGLTDEVLQRTATGAYVGALNICWDLGVKW